MQQATAWGLKNAHLEEWDFGHPGWLNDKTAVHLVSPVKDSLVVEALAWTPGTPGHDHGVDGAHRSAGRTRPRPISTSSSSGCAAA